MVVALRLVLSRSLGGLNVADPRCTWAFPVINFYAFKICGFNSFPIMGIHLSNSKNCLIGAAAGVLSFLVGRHLEGVTNMSGFATRMIGGAIGILFYLSVSAYFRNKQSR
jgi:hypothetical protein